MIRVGLGKDTHRLVEGRRFLLAGVEIPSDKGEDGHSDGDVLAHAVTDALLGAVGAGDIGEFFPDTDASFKDADSMRLLKDAFARVKEQGWLVGNLDCVVTCERPKILPYREKIRAALAFALEIPAQTVMVKGKTAERLGDIGAGLAAEALVVCLLIRRVL